jgi:hypothetical protein
MGLQAYRPPNFDRSTRIGVETDSDRPPTGPAGDARDHPGSQGEALGRRMDRDEVPDPQGVPLERPHGRPSNADDTVDETVNVATVRVGMTLLVVVLGRGVEPARGDNPTAVLPKRGVPPKREYRTVSPGGPCSAGRTT